MKRKKFLIIFILMLLLFSLTGCYDARNIEDLAYATAIGIDVADNDNITLTFQFFTPESSESDSGNKSSKTNTISVECSSINSGISLINSHISKEVNLSHCKIIVISEELAKKGISDYLDTFLNLIEVRPDCNIIISRCLAKDFLENTKPAIEILTARYYKLVLKSSEYTAYTPITKLNDLVTNIKNTFIQGHAILGGLKNGTQSSNSSYSSDASFKADETPIEYPNAIETFGTAVFYNDKLVGELDGLETISYLLTTNYFESCTLSVPDPFNVNSSIDLHLNKTKNPDINVEFINNAPYISVEIFLTGYGLTLNENIDYTSEENLKELDKYAEEYIKNQVNNYLYKTSKEFNSDISGFGKYALSQYLTLDDWKKSNWLANYKNAFFDVTVNLNIKSGYEFNESP